MRAGRLAASRSSGGAVYPSLTYRDVGAALAWLAAAFGFEAQVLDEVTAVVRSGSGAVLIQTDRPEDLHGSHTGRGWVYVVIGDVDAHCCISSSSGSAAGWSCSAGHPLPRTRSCSCCGMRSPCCAAPIPGPGWTGPTAPSSPP